MLILCEYLMNQPQKWCSTGAREMEKVILHQKHNIRVVSLKILLVLCILTDKIILGLPECGFYRLVCAMENITNF